MKAELGSPLPPGDEHAVSVYIPTWTDTVAWASREPALLAQLKTGYPRFLVPRIVVELSERLVDWAASEEALSRASGQVGWLFQDEAPALACQSYLDTQSPPSSTSTAVVGVAFDGRVDVITQASWPRKPCRHSELYAVVHAENLAAEGKAFWQHTGYGISSRCAAFWLDNAPFLRIDSPAAAVDAPKPPSYQDGLLAKYTLRQRIAALASTDEVPVTEKQVYLYPTGMSAISHTAAALRQLRRDEPGVCRVAVFGFLYVDTFKVLSKIHELEVSLYDHASPKDLDALEADLDSGRLRLDALYTEFPGNPLLRSVDLLRLSRLSREHGFLLFVDDTVATSVNTSLLPLCHALCTSLTKMFSGGCNVMGGSVVLNPALERARHLRTSLDEQYVDAYFYDDAVVMEKNSSDVETRVKAASANAARLAAMLRPHRAVAELFYPRGSPTQAAYDRHRLPDGGYGYLLSVRFQTPAAAVAFHDALDVAKGPSLGTNFTLCCAYALYAHFRELEWAAKYGVDEYLVRISVGVKSGDVLDGLVKRALDAAVEALKG